MAPRFASRDSTLLSNRLDSLLRDFLLDILLVCVGVGVLSVTGSMEPCLRGVCVTATDFGVLIFFCDSVTVFSSVDFLALPDN